MKKNLLLILLGFLSFAASSQNCFWAETAGGTANEQAIAVTTDVNGNVRITGKYSSASITFGTITLNGTTSGSDDFFVAAYDPSGAVQWANGATGLATGYGIATDISGNTFVTGYFDGASTTFGTTTLTNMGAGDAFLLKYDVNGNLLWAKSIGGSGGAEYGLSLATNAAGEVLVTGRFNSSSITIGSTTLIHHSSSGPDVFTAKYDSSGNALWAAGAGGNREDIGHGISMDAAGNSYITGTYQSDSINFGGQTLYSDAAGAHHTFITKYDPAGSLVWAKAVRGLWGSVISYDIEVNGSSLYVVGEYHGVSVKIGSDSLVNISSGSSDVFLAKFDLNGNPLWAKSGGGNNYDYGRGLTVDGAGSVSIVGFFQGTSVSFSGDVINNHGSTSFDIYIAKYNSSGAIEWAESIGSTAGEFAYSIAAGLGDNLYFAGKHNFNTSFGSTSLACNGADDIFVADVYNFTSMISSSSNISCFSGNDGSISTSVSGGNSPYTYLWSTSPAQTTANVSGLTAGSYSVTITEGYGCAQTSTVTLTEPQPDSAQICMVTVDSLSQNNIIIWDKTSFTGVDSFTVYREITTNNYQPIATIAYDSLSQFVDTVRARYFPNTGDPNAGTYRYKIAATNTCGNAGPLSPYHNTIYLLNSSGTFYWTQLYTIEGGANPVSSYVLMRDNLSNGTWTTVASVSGTQQTVADPLYAVYQATATWRVETQWSITCTPTRTITTSVSNKFSNLATTVNENKLETSFNVYPNPSEGVFTVQYSADAKNSVRSFEVYNLIGEKVYENSSASMQGTVLDLSMQPKGVYYLSVKTATEAFTKKLIIQ